MTNKDDELLPFKSYSAGQLFFIAKQAYERTKDEKSDREPGKSEAIVSIIFAASCLEAFINELADMATEMPDLMNHPESVQSFAEIMKEIEESKGSIRLKYLLTTLVFTGKTYKKNKQPYQDFSLLFRIRDSLMHLKPQDEFKMSHGHIVRVMTPKILEALQSKNILAIFDEKVVANWKSMISTQAVARWACNTAVEIVHSILRILPESYFRKGAIAAYGSIFQPIE